MAFGSGPASASPVPPLAKGPHVPAALPPSTARTSALASAIGMVASLLGTIAASELVPMAVSVFVAASVLPASAPAALLLLHPAASVVIVGVIASPKTARQRFIGASFRGAPCQVLSVKSISGECASSGHDSPTITSPPPVSLFKFSA